MRVISFVGILVTLPLGLAVIYGLAAVLWYELFRSALLKLLARRRGADPRISSVERWEESERAEAEREVAEQEAAEASEPDFARRLYYLARKAAKAERNLAIQKANEAAERAVERIEGRHREIAAELDEEEAERLSKQ